jgi:glycosyltransferase involved in cell wall biosynthesis
MQTERIAIFHPEGNITSNPHLLSFVKVLDENGYKVDIFSKYRPENPYQQFGQKSWRLFLLPQGNRFPLFVNSYVFLFGVDEGIIEAKAQADFLNIPYAHISYELFFDDEVVDDLKDEKYKTRTAAEGVSFSIVQDELRADLYSAEYGVSKERIIHMPVAGSGIVPYAKSRYLHKILNLDFDAHILLHLGSVAPWSMSDWLIEQAHTMPTGWVLVIHGRYGCKGPKNINSDRVFFTNAPVEDFDDLGKIVQSASCCAVLYKSHPGSAYTGKNIENIGLASGKFSVAMQYGVPVLVRRSGEMGNLVKKYNAGLTLSPEQGDTLGVLAKLPLESEIWSNCQSLFSEKLDLRSYMPPVLSLLEKFKKAPSLNTGFSEEPKKQLRELFQEASKLRKNDIIKLYIEAFSLILSDVFLRMKKKLFGSM